MTKELIEAAGSGAGMLKQFGGIAEMLLKPMATRALAEAEADAKLILARADIAAETLRTAARQRAELDEVRHYVNLVAALKDAKAHIEDHATRKLLPENGGPNQSDPDWFHKWASYAKETSDHDIRSLWAKVLAGEIIQPGKFSLRLLHTISLLRKSEAQDFSRLANYISNDAEGRMWYLKAHQINAWLQSRTGMDAEFFRRLENIGLVQRLREVGMPRELVNTQMSYAGKRYALKGPNVPDSMEALFVILSPRQLSHLGQELYGLCNIEPDLDYADQLFNQTLGGFQSGWSVTPLP